MTQHPRPLAADDPTWTAATGIVQVLDLEAAPHSWEIAPGVVVHGHAFNGQVPGPTIEATAGDTLAVRFTNQLSRPTAIDWHGLRIPAAMTGSERATYPVQSGTSVEYRFDLPHPGTFWYHPHVKGNAQPHPGLYGALIVRSPVEPVFDGERVLAIQGIDVNRVVHPSTPTPRPPPSRGGENSLLLVNGIIEPHMAVTAGQRERWRVINTTTTRHLRLSLTGQPFGVIGTHRRLTTAPDEADEALLAPGETLDLVIGPFAPGDTITLGASPYQPRAGEARLHKLATLHVGHPDAQSARLRWT